MELMLSLSLNGQDYEVGEPVSCSRHISLPDDHSQAFGLPAISVDPVMMDGFSGDTELGASCNVNVLRFTPHNLTHVESPAHILKSGKTLSDLPRSLFHGICVLLDLSHHSFANNYIEPDHLEPLQKFSQFSIIALKTPVSQLPMAYNFTGTDPLSLRPETSRYISQQFPQVKLLMLDLPSMDKEEDGGKLLAHRNYFDFERHPGGAEKAIVELAYFRGLKTGIYYVCCTPTVINTDAIVTDIILHDLKPLS